MLSIDPSYIDKALPIPVGRQLYGLIAYIVAFGFLPPGGRLPAVRELARDIGVAPMTVNEVYQELRAAGLIEIRPGVGAFARGDRDPLAPDQADRLSLRDDIAALIEKGGRTGLRPTDLAAMVAAQAQLAPARTGLRLALIGIFRPAALDYAEAVRAALDGSGEIAVHLLQDLRADPQVRAACAACDMVLAPFHHEQEVRTLLPGSSVAGLRFVPSQATRLALAGLDPRARVIGVARLEDYVATIRPGILEYAPHVADVRASWYDAPDLAEALEDRDVVIYATGAEGVAARLAAGVESFEFRHTPDPVTLDNLLTTLAARILRWPAPSARSKGNDGAEARPDHPAQVHDAR